jgi:hypothetical protein
MKGGLMASLHPGNLQSEPVTPHERAMWDANARDRKREEKKLLMGLVLIALLFIVAATSDLSLVKSDGEVIAPQGADRISFHGELAWVVRTGDGCRGEDVPCTNVQQWCNAVYPNRDWDCVSAVNRLTGVYWQERLGRTYAYNLRRAGDPIVIPIR